MNKKGWISLALAGVLAVSVTGVLYWKKGKDEPAPEQSHVAIYEANGLKQVAAVKDGHIAVYDGKQWQAQFWRGINLGATTPGHFPGELSPTKDDYMRWFAEMKDMNVDLVRVYTILPPHFYEALDEFNSHRADPLWLMQGIWSPEEQLIGPNRKGDDAYKPEIKDVFKKEIGDIVKVVHGDATLPKNPGHADGVYKTDVSKWMLGWVVGTEWFQEAVQITDTKHAGVARYQGTYFQAKEGATPFESWLAEMLDTVAAGEMKYGWEHPISFTNWVTADPLKHPDEPLPEEDMVSVDPMLVSPTAKFTGGYFASYHVYPYYPDMLRFEQKYQTYKTKDGKVDPYAGYLHDLRAYHAGIPIVVAEYGVPSSRGMAHEGPLGRNQGMHTEAEQGKIDADLMSDIRDEGYDGGFLFSWQDEWFKVTWNTMDLAIPTERRAMWFNRLTNEANFGVLSFDPGKSAKDMIVLDGKTDDWDKRPDKATASYPDFDFAMSHDEAYVYLMAKKKQGDWDLAKDTLDIGFKVINGGSTVADQAPGVTFKTPIQFLMQLNQQSPQLYVNSAYDQHTWLYGGTQLKMIPTQPELDKQEKLGRFFPWKLDLSRALHLPKSNKDIPFQELPVGKLISGTTDLSDPQHNTLSDYYVKGNVLEVRIPWMLLGFTDPSKLQVWDWPYKAGKLTNVPMAADGLTAQPVLRTAGDKSQKTAASLSYKWQGWELPTYHERKKDSYDILKNAFANMRELEPIPNTKFTVQ